MKKKQNRLNEKQGINAKQKRAEQRQRLVGYEQGQGQGKGQGQGQERVREKRSVLVLKVADVVKICNCY